MSEFEFDLTEETTPDVPVKETEKTEYAQVRLEEIGLSKRSSFLQKVEGIPLAASGQTPYSFFEPALREEDLEDLISSGASEDEIIKEQRRAIGILSAALRNYQRSRALRNDIRFYTIRTVEENNVVGIRVLRLHPDDAPKPQVRKPRKQDD